MLEVFNEISKRITKSIMFYEDLADYFDFLDLHGLKRWNEARFFEENTELRGIHRYVINHYNRLLEDGEIEHTKIIPSSWYGYTRMSVDPTTRKQAVKQAMEKWYEWDKDTKDLYQKMFKKLTENGEIAAADKVNELVKRIDQEVKVLCRKYIEYKALDYDMQYIMFQQDELHEHYKDHEKHLGVDIC